MTALYGELAASVKGLGHTVELGNDLLRAQHALQMAIKHQTHHQHPSHSF